MKKVRGFPEIQNTVVLSAVSSTLRGRVRELHGVLHHPRVQQDLETLVHAHQHRTYSEAHAALAQKIVQKAVPEFGAHEQRGRHGLMDFLLEQGDDTLMAFEAEAEYALRQLPPKQALQRLAHITQTLAHVQVIVAHLQGAVQERVKRQQPLTAVHRHIAAAHPDVQQRIEAVREAVGRHYADLPLALGVQGAGMPEGFIHTDTDLEPPQAANDQPHGVRTQKSPGKSVHVLEEKSFPQSDMHNAANAYTKKPPSPKVQGIVADILALM